ncbi:aldose epimerase family protein [Solitalea koreensis]|uniref:Aldose 1-epimerase n=1 Tax=Solitalea koreensis TaxID=543615 RepID=A0A521AZ57_9SPHI|nr:aldose epimerase family protein [Solitalea koreensis]SMO40079.1 aldose 1-epimerase [Solitalea koreensis]
MKVNKQYCGTTAKGDLYLISLENEKGTSVEILNYGAIIKSFKVKAADGKEVDIVLGFDNVDEYFSKEYLSNYPYFGAVIGRYANRVKGGKFKIDGKDYQIAQNQNGDCLHGGIEGFDKKVFEVIGYTALPNPTVTLRYISSDGEEHFPGNLDLYITFELNNENELSYEFKATTDAPTAVNITHHSYFNLDGGATTIGEHLLTINADNYLEQDSNYVVTGNLIPIASTAHDFRTERTINRDMDPEEGYDQSFVIANPGGLALAAKAKSKETGVQLNVFTTEPVVHLYCGKYIPEIKGKNGVKYGPFHAFCLETQVHPNAINIPSLPDTILRPGSVYSTRTVYKVSNGNQG